MPKRYIETVVKMDGEAEYKKALSNINGELKTLGSESKLIQAEFKGQANSMEALEAKGKNLKAQLQEQSEAVKTLERALAESKDAYGDHAKETQQWQQKLNRAKANLIELGHELQDNEKYMDEARRSTDGCASSIDKFGREVKQAEGEIAGFEDVVKTALGAGGFGDLTDMLGRGLAVGAVVGGLKEVADGVLDVVENTKEYRTTMASLENSSKRAGYTAEQTKETYTQLYGVLGDNQTAATAAANLQALSLNQELLTQMTNGAIGAWSEYGNSIPIDQMAESINIAAQQSEVSSALADIIEWAGGNVDEFKASLEAANGTEERAKIILQELTRQGLTEAGKAWRQNNEDIVNVNLAQSEYEAAIARLGTILAPVAAGMINFAADGIGAVIDAFEEAVTWAKQFIDWMRQAGDAPDPTGKHADSKANGSHAAGLYRVPFDGYVAETHKDEMIVPAAQADILRKYFSSGFSTLQAADSYRSSQSDSDTSGGVTEIINITVVSELDGRKVGEGVTTYQKTQRRANGR